MIGEISTKLLCPHPRNPRRDLGDLTELAASIRENGIFQNLTVVPQEAGYCFSCKRYIASAGKCEEGHDNVNEPPCPEWESRGKYTVVIGHRRLAAAKLAGLESVPCAIADMDEKTQLATMLLENMQRSDLTILEQAEGFQLMFDLGESVETVAKATGFSESTIRRRVKLLELDRESLAEAEQRGGTLQDYAELDKIRDPERKNAVLQAIGTPNFKYKLASAIGDEKAEACKADLIEKLAAFATRVESAEGYRVLRTFSAYSNHDLDNFTQPEDTGTCEYFYTETQYGQLCLLVEAPAEDDPAEAEKRQAKAELDARRDALDAITGRAYDLREAFVREYPGLKKDGRALMAMAASILTQSERFYLRVDDDMFLDLMGIEVEAGCEGDNEEAAAALEAAQQEAVTNACEVHPEKALLAMLYCCELDNPNWQYYDHHCRHTENKYLDQAYEVLCKFGYEMSDEERALQDGSHELFVVEGGV